MLDELTSGTLVGLTPVECWERLAATRVGRVVYSDDQGPLAVPVNFVVQDHTVLFRTAPNSALGRHLRESATCAFEVDEIDAGERSGWSVLVRGSASVVRHLASEAHAPWPSPWPAGSRHLVIRISARELTGRRLVPF